MSDRLPPMPQMPSPPPERSGSWFGTLLGVVTAAVLIVGVVLLITASLGPVGLAAIAIGVVVFLLILLQYALWGWWLGPAIRRQAKRDQEE
jgi:glycerol uptake facilitator-like aquaporin